MPNVPAQGLNPAQQQVAARLERFRRYVFDAVELRLAVEHYRLHLVAHGMTAEEQANQSLREALEWVIQRGPTTVRQHAVVDYWAALEVFVEDVFADICAAVDLTGQQRLARVRVPLAEFAKLGDEQRFRLLWERVESPSAAAVDRWDDVLGIVGVNVDIGAVPAIPEWPARDNASVRVALREFQQVRNVIVHRGGVVDARLVAVARHAQFADGNTLLVTDELTDEYGRAAIDYASAATAAAVNRLA